MFTHKALQISKTISRVEGLDSQNLLDTLKSLDHTHKSICQTIRFTQVLLIEIAEVWLKCLQVKLHSRRSQPIRRKEWLFNIHQVAWITWTKLDKEMLWFNKCIQLSLWSTQWQLTIKIMRIWVVLDKSTIAIMMDLVKLRKNMVI